MKKRFQLLALSVLCAVFAHAQYVAPSEGVFRIINVGYNAALMENYESNEVFCTSTIGDADDFNQLWILEKSGTGYSIKNAYTGAYIQTGNNEQEKPYWTGSTAKAFNIKAVGGDAYNIFDPGLGEWGLHSKGANARVVRWSDCDPSRWQFEKVEVSVEAMTLAQAEYAEYLRLKIEFENYSAELLENLNKFETALYKYFEDAACTVLKEAFASATDENLRESMNADELPKELVDMAVKVKNAAWAEPNEVDEKPGWDDHYAKKFRVQLIEPYSIAGEITEWIGHQGHTNMDNPTGLYANNRQVFYIMVEGEVKEGAELYATWIAGHSKMPNYGSYGDNGVRLKSGLNIVPIRTDGSALYINYLVHTYDKEKKQFTNKLSDYDDLKVHVAGGYINSYYNAVGDSLYTADNDDDWVYYEERANLENITILGRYEVLQFELNDVVNYVNDKGETVNEKGLAYYFPERLPTSMPNSPAFTAPNQRINAIVEAWDRIFLSEKLTLGVASKAEADSANKLFPRYDGTWTEKAEIYNYDDELLAFCDSIKKRDGDYGEYYNHHGLAYGTRSGYMYGSWDHSGYHINTTHSILTCIATEAGPTWGPAHEIGHQHQALYTLNGEMEVTNNTFANVAAWYMGMGTSRVNGTEGNLAHVYDNFKNGGYLLSNNIWALTQRYYRLWLYYHRVGNNTQFFPRLFELIRQKPMERSYADVSKDQSDVIDEKTGEKVSYQKTNGYRSYLHFYKLCCEAAQEDLTEFFRAYGCFTPVDGVFQGDYTNSKYYTTQKEIDKAIAEVKAKGYPVNNKVLFINDCTNEVTYGHDGKTVRSFWDPQTGRRENAEVGLYVDYLNGTPITGEYVYTLEDLKLTIKGGTGAVGFAIYNKEGEIQAFSNNHTFYLNKETANALRAGEGTLYAVAAEGKDVAIAMNQGSESEQLKNLKNALTVARNYLGKVDNGQQIAGYLIPDSITDYVELVAKVEKVIENEDTSEGTYGEWYASLDAANAQVLSNKAWRTQLTPESFYTIAISSSGRPMTYTSTGLSTAAATQEITYNEHWRFVPAVTEDGKIKANTYYLQNRETGYYITYAESGKRMKAESYSKTDAVEFTLAPEAPGEFYLQIGELNVYNYASASNRVYLGIQNGNTAKWELALKETTWELPSVRTSNEISLYYLQHGSNEKYANVGTSGSSKGRVKLDDFSDAVKDNDYYLFYFAQGNEEGKYAIYNYATGCSVIKNSKSRVVANEVTETTVDYTIELNESKDGLALSSTEGVWSISGNYIAFATKNGAPWKLIKVATISLTVDQAEVALIEGETTTLTAETNSGATIEWSSSDESIATVDAAGQVTAVASGTATITVTAGPLTTTCLVTVTKEGEGQGISSTTTAGLTIQAQGGAVTINGLAAGTNVSIYNAAGSLVGAATASNGTATIDTNLAKGSIVIVKIGTAYAKVTMK